MAAGKLRRRPGRLRLLLLPALLGTLLAAGGIAGMGLARPVVPVAPVVEVPAAFATPDRALRWPLSGNSAVDVPALGLSLRSPNQHVGSIASVTKIMTALVIVNDFPLEPGQSGPTLTFTKDDVADWEDTVHRGGSNVKVVEGEHLSLQQCLQALLVRSANNIARKLAVYDAGSVEAFTVKMNEQAKAMGMASTTYVEPSGFKPGSKSTPSDQMIAAKALYANPVLREIVGQEYVDLPENGSMASYTPMVNQPGVKGIKSGRSVLAGGCDVMAYEAEVQGVTTTAFVVVMNYRGPDVLLGAGLEALDLSHNLFEQLQSTTLAKQGRVVGTAGSWWGSAPVVEAKDVTALAFHGSALRYSLHLVKVRDGAKAGTSVGSYTVTGAAGLREVVPLVLGADLPKVTLLTRVR